MGRWRCSLFAHNYNYSLHPCISFASSVCAESFDPVAHVSIMHLADVSQHWHTMRATAAPLIRSASVRLPGSTWPPSTAHATCRTLYSPPQPPNTRTCRTPCLTCVQASMRPPMHFHLRLSGEAVGNNPHAAWVRLPSFGSTCTCTLACMRLHAALIARACPAATTACTCLPPHAVLHCMRQHACGMCMRRFKAALGISS